MHSPKCAAREALQAAAQAGRHKEAAEAEKHCNAAVKETAGEAPSAGGTQREQRKQVSSRGLMAR